MTDNNFINTIERINYENLNITEEINNMVDNNLIDIIEEIDSKNYNIFELLEFKTSVEDAYNIFNLNNKHIIYEEYDGALYHHIDIEGKWNGKLCKIFYAFFMNQFIRGGYFFQRDTRLDDNLIGYSNFDDKYLKYNIYTREDLIMIMNEYITVYDNDPNIEVIYYENNQSAEFIILTNDNIYGNISLGRDYLMINYYHKSYNDIIPRGYFDP
jgi:hypothetical protein